MKNPIDPHRELNPLVAQCLKQLEVGTVAFFLLKLLEALLVS
jgi:hypothetical protein